MTKNSAGALAPEVGSSQSTWENLDRQDWQLWLMSTLLILVLGVGLLSFMFPTVFWMGGELALKAPERAFFGFSVLLALALGYLLQKNSKVRQLKRELFQAQAALTRAGQDAAIQAFETLPTLLQFRDMLAMEYRRASTSGIALAVVLFTAVSASREGLGRMTSLLRSMLRQGETLYRISDKAVGVILPGMKLSNGAAFAAQVESLGGFPDQELQVNIIAYPEDASSLSELEGKLRRQNNESQLPEAGFLPLRSVPASGLVH